MQICQNAPVILRIGALIFIFVCTAIAWAILGTTILQRTYRAGPGLKQRVESSWGSRQDQGPPEAVYALTANPLADALGPPKNSDAGARPAVEKIPIESSKIDVALELEHRQKGLLWYSTYGVRFSGAYVFRADPRANRPATFTWRFPAEQAIYDDLFVALDGRPLAFRTEGHAITATAELTAAEPTLLIRYRSQGLDEWRYNFGANVTQVRDFSLRMTTNFRDIDFPENGLSPTQKQPRENGWELGWRYQNLVSGYNIAMAMPAKLQPGPLAGEISYFAPVSLFFFFFVMFIVTTLRRIDLHPMNYFFLAAAFFSFHLLLAYLVDHISIHLAFAICSLVSIGLVVSYLRLVLGLKFAAREAALAQLLYLILFSYAFFFKGYTGLAVTIGAILSLFVVMQATGRLDWAQQFRRGAAAGVEG
jgi:hypothetical protein